MAGEFQGLYLGTVLKRENDPANDPTTKFDVCIGRLKASIPGMMEETAWALPRGWGGSELWGRNGPVPPVGADVLIQFVNGDPDQPRWEPAHPGESEVFPEFVHPDVVVWGDRFLRVSYDMRDGQRFFRIAVVKPVGDEERTIIELAMDIENNAARLYAGRALALETGGHLQLSASGDCEIKGRKVMPSGKAIN